MKEATGHGSERVCQMGVIHKIRNHNLVIVDKIRNGKIKVIKSELIIIEIIELEKRTRAIGSDDAIFFGIDLEQLGKVISIITGHRVNN